MNSNNQLKSNRFNYLKNRNLEFWCNWDLASKTKCPFCDKPINIIHRDMTGLSQRDFKHGRRDASTTELMLSPHYRRQHLDELVDKLEDVEAAKDEDEQGYICPICNKAWVTLGAHIRRDHKLSWDDFIEQYHFTGCRIKATEAHKAALSQNKKDYYASEKGLERKKVQSTAISGLNNPACREDIRKKISDACQGRKVSDHLKEINSQKMSDRLSNRKDFSRGYSYHFILNDRLYKARSSEELSIILALINNNNIEFSYEPCAFKYQLDVLRSYTPDIQIGNIFYEIKSVESEFEIVKYEKCKEVISKAGFDLQFLNHQNIREKLNILVPNKEELKSIIKDLVLQGNMQIVKPITKCNTYPFLEKLFGKNYDDVLNSYKEIFNENKKRLCREK